MKPIQKISIIAAAISFSCVIGGGLYEHTAVVPRWASQPPVSLAMFQGDYGLNPAMFWRPIHPITVLLFIFALTANWKTPNRNSILTALLGYVVVLGVTFAYFVPELLDIIHTAPAATVDPALQARAGRWELLSQIRLFFMAVLAVVLLWSFAKSEKQ